MEQNWTDEELEAPLDDETESSITRAFAEVRGFEDGEVATASSMLRPAIYFCSF